MQKALLPIFLIVVVDILGMTIVLPLLPFYAEHMGATPTVVGMLVSVFALCQLIGGPLLGRISDHSGRKPLLLLSQAGTLIGFLILAYANSLWLVFLSRIIDGFTAGNISLAQAYIADVTKPEERTKSFAIIGIAFGIGFLIGPALGGFLSQYGYQYPIFAAMALSATSIIATWVFLPSSVPSLDRSARKLSILDWGAYAAYFRRPGLARLLWQFFAFIMGFSTFMSGFALFAERRFTWHGQAFGPKEVGYVYAFVGLIGIIVQGGLIGRAVKWLGDLKLVSLGFLAGAIGFTLLAFTHGIVELLWVAALISVSVSAVRPALTTLITVAADRTEQGSVLGLTQSLMAISSIVAPLLSGLLIEHRLLATWALMAAIFSATGFLLQTRRVKAAQPAEQIVSR